MSYFALSFADQLALVILLGRIGDVASTLFVTPTLALEANPVVRRIKWPTIALGFLLCAVPYLDLRLGVMVAVPSLLVTSSNLSRGWLARALGEEEMLDILQRAAARGSLRVALLMLWIALAFFLLAAGMLIYLVEDADALAYWFALGMVAYAAAVGVHGTLFLLRVFRASRGRCGEDEPADGC